MAAQGVFDISVTPRRILASYNLSSSPILFSPSQLISSMAGCRTSREEENGYMDSSFSPPFEVNQKIQHAPGGQEQKKTLANGKTRGPSKPRRTSKVLKVRDSGCEEATITKKVKKSTTGQQSTSKEKNKPTRKPRAKKIDGATQSKLPKGRVIKPSQRSSPTKIDHVESTKSCMAEGPSPDVDKIIETILRSPEPKAVNRKILWTPPRSVPEVICLATPDEVELQNHPSTSTGSEHDRKEFPDLLGNFGFKQTKIHRDVSKSVAPLPPKKRKLIEMVNINISSSTGSTNLPAKAPRKKIATITDRAIAAFTIQDESISRTDSVHRVPYTGQAGNILSKRLPTAQPKSSRGTKLRTQKGKGTVEAPILLSPETALVEVKNQDFVFGTSSQLARETSPTLLRDIHRAMQASNETDDDPFYNTNSPVGIEKQSACMSETGRGSRDLWSAAARDLLGDVLPVETDHHKPDLVTATLTDEIPTHEPVETRTDSRAASATMPNYNALSMAQLAKKIKSYHFKPIKRREDMIQLLEKCWESKYKSVNGGSVSVPIPLQSKAKAPSNEGMLSSEAATKTAPDNSRISITRNAPPVSAPAKCSGRHLKEKEYQISSTSTKENIAPSSPNPLFSKSLKSTLAGRIYDDESEVDERLQHQTRSSKLVRDQNIQVNSGKEESIVASEDNSEAQLFACITRAIKNAAPTMDPSCPSWHEKMLLFDPIVLEDLAAWLNMGPLEKVGWDGEICPKQVKKWCESKSICCLWKQNLRGETRSRF